MSLNFGQIFGMSAPEILMSLSLKQIRQLFDAGPSIFSSVYLVLVFPRYKEYDTLPKKK